MNIEPWKGKKIPHTPRQVMISWPPSEQEIWRKFLEICERDGHSAAGEVRKFITQEVEKRSPGNPQKPLDPFQDSKSVCRHKFAWIRQPSPHLDQELWRCKHCGVKEEK